MLPISAPTPASFLASAVQTARPLGSSLSDGRLQVEWAAIGEPIAAIAAFLRERGIAPGEPVALECVNSAPGALTLLALLLDGTTFALLPAPARGVAAPPVPKFLSYKISVRSPLLLGGDAALQRPETFLDITAVADHRPLPAQAPLRRDQLLLRTSGSLASPKLVVHTHAGLLGNALLAVERLGLGSQDRVLIPVPLAHMYGLGAAFLPALAVGASVELIEGTNLLRYLERERSFQPTVAFFTPNLCAMLLRPRSAPAHYRHVVVAGDKLSPASFHSAEALYRRVLNLYGTTEMGVVCAAAARAAAGPRAVTVGPPLPGVALRLVSPPDAATAAAGLDGAWGELLCAHPYGFTGYVDDDGQPFSLGCGDIWFDTRDLARFHPDGLLEVLGRSDHAVKRDGRLVMLAELERAIERLPGVARAAAVVAGETMRGRAIVVFCTPCDGVFSEPGRLLRACQETLPAYAVPDQIRLLPALPLLSSGKLDRRALAHSVSLQTSPLEASSDHGP